MLRAARIRIGRDARIPRVQLGLRRGKTGTLLARFFLLAGTCVTLPSGEAGAQTVEACRTQACIAVQNSGQTQILAPFASYLSSVSGQALLQANLNTEVSIYLNPSQYSPNGAYVSPSLTTAQNNYNLRNLAAQNAQLQNLVANIWSMVNAPAATTVVNLVNQGTYDTFLSSFYSPLYSVTQIGSTKDAYAALNIYGQAYGYSGPGAGDPRPFLTSPAIANARWTTADASDAAVRIQAVGSESWDSLSSEGAFPSGHTAYGTDTALLSAVMVPQLYQQLLLSSENFGYSRNVFGAHYPLDVIGGRMQAMYTLVQMLSNNPSYVIGDYASLVTTSAQQLQTLIAQAGTPLAVPYASCAGSVAACIAANVFPSAAAFTQATASYRAALTYGLPSVGSTTDAPIVPVNAELLIATRFPYLSQSQLRDVLATTELPSGVPLDDHATGWARLNLYAASQGYGAFTGNVTVDMDAARGGYSAIDVWANNISGTGSLTKQGSGTLVLAGNNTYSGGTTVRGGVLALTGTLIGDLDIRRGGEFVSAGGYAVAPNAKLTNDGTFTSVNASLLNLGTLRNSGLLASPLVNGGSVANTGTINGAVANAGVLNNNGTINGQVSNSGLLSGTGTINGGLISTGIVSPGNSIGTVTVNGAVTLAPGSSYQVELGANGQSDRIVASGPITISGSNLQVLSAPLQMGSYTILSSTGGIVGSFASVENPFGATYPFLTTAASVSGGSTSLSVVRSATSFRSAGITANQKAAGAGLDSLSTSSPLVQTAVSLSAAAAPGTFDSLSGQTHASAPTVLQAQSFYLRDAIGSRLRQAEAARSPQAPAALSYAGGGPETLPVMPGTVLTAWTQGYGSWGESRATDNTGALSRSTGGFLAGLDAPVGAGRLGLAAGYGQSNYSVGTLASSGQADTSSIAAYGSTEWGLVQVRAGASYSWNDLSSGRTVWLAGQAQRLTSGQNGGTTQVFGELARGFDLPGVRVEPFAGLSYVNVALGGFSETGGSAALSSGGQSQQTTYSNIGLRAAKSFTAGTGVLALHGGLAWQYAFGDLSPAIAMGFAGGAPFTVSGAPIARNAALVDAGIDYVASANFTLGIAYSGQLSGQSQDNAVTGRLSMKF